MPRASSKNILPALEKTMEQLIGEFEQIPGERKQAIMPLVNFIRSRNMLQQKVMLNFICTHNSRRSHIAQIWAQTAAFYYHVDNIRTFSGGTEATAFNPRAVKALQSAGFDISIHTDGNNPVYEVHFSNDASPLLAFSKKYDDPENPNQNFAAVMTCSHADENCPLIKGSDTRIAITYDDPKDFDDTPSEGEKYRERVHQIGREFLYAFSLVSGKK